MNNLYPSALFPPGQQEKGPQEDGEVCQVEHIPFHRSRGRRELDIVVDPAVAQPLVEVCAAASQHQPRTQLGYAAPPPGKDQGGAGSRRYRLPVLNRLCNLQP